MKKLFKGFGKNKEAVFGLTAIQEFFVIILGLALLAFVIVIIMGTLNSSTILAQPSSLNSNETVNMTEAGVALAASSNAGCVLTSVSITNWTTEEILSSANYTINSPLPCYISAAADSEYKSKNVNVTYTYSYNSQFNSNTQSILTNTSSGVTNFFGTINPVYAILAVLVIILVLLVLVRVVSAPTGAGMAGSVQL